jgi:hypothetical protein
VQERQRWILEPRRNGKLAAHESRRMPWTLDCKAGPPARISSTGKSRPPRVAFPPFAAAKDSLSGEPPPQARRPPGPSARHSKSPLGSFARRRRWYVELMAEGFVGFA